MSKARGSSSPRRRRPNRLGRPGHTPTPDPAADAGTRHQPPPTTQTPGAEDDAGAGGGAGAGAAKLAARRARVRVRETLTAHGDDQPPMTVVEVADRADVHRSWLYEHPDLLDAIEAHRHPAAQQAPGPTAGGAGTAPAPPRGQTPPLTPPTGPAAGPRGRRGGSPPPPGADPMTQLAASVRAAGHPTTTPPPPSSPPPGSPTPPTAAPQPPRTPDPRPVDSHDEPTDPDTPIAIHPRPAAPQGGDRDGDTENDDTENDDTENDDIEDRGNEDRENEDRENEDRGWQTPPAPRSRSRRRLRRARRGGQQPHPAPAPSTAPGGHHDDPPHPQPPGAAPAAGEPPTEPDLPRRAGPAPQAIEPDPARDGEHDDHRVGGPWEPEDDSAGPHRSGTGPERGAIGTGAIGTGAIGTGAIGTGTGAIGRGAVSGGALSRGALSSGALSRGERGGRGAPAAAALAAHEVGGDPGLRAAVTRRFPGLAEPEVDTAVSAGALALMRAAGDPRPPVAAQAADTGRQAAEATAARAAQIARSAPAALSRGESPPWLELAGLVVPVWGATSGAGVSVFCASLFDALDAAGVATILIDAADPARSGLATASEQGPPRRYPAEDIAISAGWRGHGHVLQLVTPPAGVLSAGMVPAPAWWLPNNRAPEVTIVDLGWDPWALAAYPLRGPGAWMEITPDTPENLRPCPVLVCAPSRPSLARADQVLTRLRAWTQAERIPEVLALVVSGAQRWPRGVSGSGGREVTRLEPAHFLPHHPRVAAGGIDTDPMPAKLQRAAGRLADDWGLR